VETPPRLVSESRLHAEQRKRQTDKKLSSGRSASALMKKDGLRSKRWHTVLASTSLTRGCWHTVFVRQCANPDFGASLLASNGHERTND
jgi:hypothetical protein